MSDERREPERSDLYAVKDAAGGKCICPVSVRATKCELTFEQFRRLACKVCQAQACLEWLMELSEEG